MPSLLQLLGIDPKTQPDVEFEFIGNPDEIFANSGATIYQFNLLNERKTVIGHKNRAHNVGYILAGPEVIAFLLKEEENGTRIFEWKEIDDEFGIGKLRCKGVVLDVSQAGEVWLVKKGQPLYRYPFRRRNQHDD